MLKLVLPDISYKKEYESMKKKWSKFEDINETSPGALFYGKKFEDFLEITEKYRTNSPTSTNSTLYFLIDEEKNMLGAVDIRHSIKKSEVLNEFGGHIGYGITPEYRKKGYGKVILKLALFKAKELDIKKVLITCKVDNIASKKIIEANYGVFDRKSKCGNFYRFFIDLK